MEIGKMLNTYPNWLVQRWKWILEIGMIC